jgi:hypothetical protein
MFHKRFNYSLYADNGHDPKQMPDIRSGDHFLSFSDSARNGNIDLGNGQPPMPTP